MRRLKKHSTTHSRDGNYDLRLFKMNNITGGGQHGAPIPSHDFASMLPLKGGCHTSRREQVETPFEVAVIRKNQSDPRKDASSPLQAAQLRPIGVIRSTLKNLEKAPMQGSEGAPDAWLEVNAFAREALEGLHPGDQIIVITWLHQSDRDLLKVHPRSDPNRPLTGVFATRSPDRPNPLGLHPVTIRRIVGSRLQVGPIEAIDGTPVVDIKPML